MKMRLDKFLAEMSVGSRSQVKALIQKGKVLVNGEAVKAADFKIDPEQDHVCCDGQEIRYAACEYYMLNKPAGVLSAANDKKAVTVVDLIESRLRKDLFPVGRLDKDTEGLLLITNDGALAHRLLAPKKHVDKTYYVELDQAVTKEDIARLEQGVDIGDEKVTLPCSICADWEAWDDGRRAEKTDLPERRQLEVLLPHALDMQHLLITIHEGRFHQIKRMFESCGSQVVYLKRLRMGTLILDAALENGASRALTAVELDLLLQ